METEEVCDRIEIARERKRLGTRLPRTYFMNVVRVPHHVGLTAGTEYRVHSSTLVHSVERCERRVSVSATMSADGYITLNSEISWSHQL